MTGRTSAEQGLSPIVKTVAGWLRTPILVYAIYTVLYGHLGPGGGFAGGVMIAIGLALQTLAYGEKPAGRDAARSAAAVMASAGALLFLVAAFAGMVTSGTFFQNVLPTSPTHGLWSGGLIAVYEVAIALLVAGGLFVAFGALAGAQRRLAAGGDGQEGA